MNFIRCRRCRARLRIFRARFRWFQKFRRCRRRLSCRDLFRFRGKLHSPKIRRGLRKLQLHVIPRLRVFAPPRHLRDDFFPRLLVTQKQQLSCRYRKRQPDHPTIRKHQCRRRRLFKKFAFSCLLSGACARCDHRRFMHDRIRSGRRWGVRRGCSTGWRGFFCGCQSPCPSRPGACVGSAIAVPRSPNRISHRCLNPSTFPNAPFSRP